MIKQTLLVVNDHMCKSSFVTEFNTHETKPSVYLGLNYDAIYFEMWF